MTEGLAPSPSWLRTRIIILAAAFILALGIAVSAKAYIQYFDTWNVNVLWVDPNNGGNGLANLNEAFYGYVESPPWPYEYSTATHNDSCGCLTYVAAKAYIVDYDWFPWTDSGWVIDPTWANATKSHSSGYWAYGLFQAYVYTGWTTYFEDSPVLGY
jgi:hypothetical protein